MNNEKPTRRRRRRKEYITECVRVCVRVWPPLQHVPTFNGQMPLLPQVIAMEVGKVDHIRSYHTLETWQTGVGGDVKIE